MSILSHLEPKAVFHFFEQICAIPHGSRNTKALSDWCVDFARSRGLYYHQDKANNVVMIQEASSGYEAVPPLILQGHLDMVCEKTSGCRKDMSREGLDLMVDGDRVYAQNTTLGGDDGIAVAMALAILDNPSIPHPRLEVLLTTEEEIGMLGAKALDVSCLRGRQLLNLDSEKEGVFTVSCAGGSRVKCLLPFRRAPFDGITLHLAVSGLTGGHSGMEIHKGRANACILLGRLLRHMASSTELRLLSVAGGPKNNAISTEAEAALSVTDAAAARAAVGALAEALKNEYRLTDPSLSVTLVPAAEKQTPIDAEGTARALCLLACVPNGVQAMSQEISGLVQTSLNLGVLSTGTESLTAEFCVRSSLESQKIMLQDRLCCLMEALGGSIEVFGTYPAWEYRVDSPLRKRMTRVFQAQYGYAPEMEAVHGGVECGILCGKLPGLDCVSIGPDLKEIHTPRESMSVASVQRVWRFILEVLKESR